MLFAKKITINSLSAAVDIAQDALGIISIAAECEADALAAWGYIHARDRFFQMDFLKRKAAGRLSELFGQGAFDLDKEQRFLNMPEYARALWQSLPAVQKAMLESYAAGVNAGAHRTIEHRILRGHADIWQPSDTLLIMLDLFKGLAFDLDGLLCLETMRNTLPDEITAFFTPEADNWSAPAAAAPVVPQQAFAQLCKSLRAAPHDIPINESATKGSNAWAVAGHLCCDGQPILANDMHLPLLVPNIWHRVRLQYADVAVTGIALPGLPMILSGANDTLAWGLTNLPGHTVALEDLPQEEAAPIKRVEIIKIAGKPAQTVTYHDTRNGHLLQGVNKIVRWSFKDSDSVNLALYQLARARNVADGITVASQAGNAPVNLLMVDTQGNIARTIAGNVPVHQAGRVDMARRNVFANVQSIINPASGMLVSANDPVYLQDGACAGWNNPSSYRRARIEEALHTSDQWDEQATFALQQDKRVAVLDFYRDLALESLNSGVQVWPVAALEQWDGFASRDDRTACLLAKFRTILHRRIASYYLAPCTAQNASFRYAWRNPEPAMRALLNDRNDALVPAPHTGWAGFIASALQETVKELGAQKGKNDAYFRAAFLHPLGRNKWLTFFNLKPWYAANQPDCISSLGDGVGATERLVISPGRQKNALFAMPGGQSGNPFSRHYRDHHAYWIAGKCLPFLPGKAVKRWHIHKGESGGASL